jgi:predicted ArsR family transcriptional regulator
LKLLIKGDRQDDMQDRVIISDQQSAAAFASSRQRKIIQTLMADEMTLGELSRSLQLPLNLLHYHVTKAMALGLIAVVREQRRAGRTIKHYRATACSFFLPAELIVEMPGTGFTEQLRDMLDQNLARSLRGIDFTHDGRSPRAHLVKDPTDQAAAVELWLDAGLSRADADELAATLQAVIDQFRARGNDKEPRYLVHLAMVRV